MKKFSILINESAIKSKNSEIKIHQLVNKVDVDEIFKPLIEHIETNCEINGTSDSLFSKKTFSRLKELITSINDDYICNWIGEFGDKDKTPPESFLKEFDIKIDYAELLECIQPLSDHSDLLKSSNPSTGVFNLNFSNLSYRHPTSILDMPEDFFEDIKDVFGKLKMFDINFKFTFGIINAVYKSIDDDQENCEDYIDKLLHEQRVKSITISIYNKETLFI